MKRAEKTCFVIIGYGPKMDYATGRELDMDKTFNYIIKPAFEELGFLCFRASDISHSGVIDVPMYDHILKSDFVIADLSTLNANVLYELGIRHAVRKNTTIIISESELKYPFDLSHIVIEPYQHLGKAIDYGEVIRFKDLLQKKITELLKEPKTDSPLYTFFPDLEIPRFTAKEVEDIKENIKEDGSLSDLMLASENARKENNFERAFEYLHKALELNQDNVLVTQRLALLTYKSKIPNKYESLHKALEILEPLKPKLTTDLETLGLAGAIYKRLFEEDNNNDLLKKSIWFYEKGFYIGNDYYNGVNLAFLFLLQASLIDNKIEAIMNYGNGLRIHVQLEQICKELIGANGWDDRDDKVWIYLTLAEIAFVGNDINKEGDYLKKAEECQDKFALDSYKEQRTKLRKILADIEAKYADIIRNV